VQTGLHFETNVSICNARSHDNTGVCVAVILLYRC
jgi:hypothetical protein